MTLTEQQLHETKSKATEDLKNNDVGGWTKPAPRLYPHRWLWDTIFIILGLLFFSVDRAKQEALNLRQGQWKNGMFPHILMNSLALDYEPGPKFWSIEESPDAPKGIQTSGITQPPIEAYGVLEVFRQTQDVTFLRQMFLPLMRHHRFLLTQCDPQQEGLACILHPWSSGLDNSPRWRESMARMKMEWIPDFKRGDNIIIAPEQRPTNEDYLKYAYLVELFLKNHYNFHQIIQKGAFVVQDVLFNSLMYASLCALLEIAGILGEETAQIEDWIQRSRHAINSKLWSEQYGMYIDYDLAAEQPIITNTVAQFIPLFAGLPTADQAELMVEKLTSSDFWPEDGYPVCSVATSDPAFKAECMWQGPTWINTVWLIIRGLERYGYHEFAHKMTEKTLEVVYKNIATFTLTTTSLKQLKEDKLPDNILDCLEGLQDQKFATQDLLLEAVRMRIGKENLFQYAEQIVERVHNGFYEHYDPFTGLGGGARQFSWTASLTINLIESYKAKICNPESA